MKKNVLTTLIVILTCSMVISQANCTSTKPASLSEPLEREYIGEVEMPPEDIFERKTIYDLALDPELYAGTFIITEGNIVSVCPVGCYFYMHDKSGNQVYVDLAPQNFDVPQSALKQNVEVWGLGSLNGGAPKISAYKIIFLNVDETLDVKSLDRIPEKDLPIQNQTVDR